MPPKRKPRPEMVVHPLGTEIYDTEQVARFLNLSVRTILGAIEKGELDAKKTGKQYLITREAVQKYWDNIPSAAKPKSKA
jgi:excisionase family DNA binding protein